jgi:hypothetical protein
MCVDVGRVTNVSGVHVVSKFRVNPKDGGIIYTYKTLSALLTFMHFKDLTFLCSVFFTNFARKLSGYLQYSHHLLYPQKLLWPVYKAPIHLG